MDNGLDEKEGFSGRWTKLYEAFVPAEKFATWIAVWVFALVLAIGAVCLIFVFSAPVWVTYLVCGVLGLVVLILAATAIWWPRIAYRFISYRVDAKGLEIKKGVLWRRVISIPSSRIQHTDLTQGPIERKYGLARLVVYTAGAMFCRVELSGLSYATAEKIRDFLIQESKTDGV